MEIRRKNMFWFKFSHDDDGVRIYKFEKKSLESSAQVKKMFCTHSNSLIIQSLINDA